MKKITMVLFVCFLLGPSLAEAQKKRKIKKINIKYQKRQKIDLGALMIDGELVSPGDFSVGDEKQGSTEMLFKRKNYNDRVRINIEYVF